MRTRAKPVNRQGIAAFLRGLLLALPVLAGVGLAGLRWSGALRAGESTFAIREGVAFPALHLRAPGGELVSTDAMLSGGVRAVAVVDPACAHCLTELAWLDHRAAATPRHGEAAAISIGSAADTERLRTQYPRVLIYHDAERSLVFDYGLSFVPVLLVVDAGGVVRRVEQGWAGAPRLQEFLDGGCESGARACP